MLDQYHYLKKPFDETVSSQFLDRYLETLDPQHIHFTQADLARVRALPDQPQSPDQYRPPSGATRPPPAKSSTGLWSGWQQRTAYADDLLKHEKFTFDTDERITINRKELPYPADLDEAKKLWRERLRFEYLQELLGKIGARKKNLAAAKQGQAAARRNERAGQGSGNRPPPELPPRSGQSLEAAQRPRGVAAGDQPDRRQPTPKKTDDEEIVDTLSHRYHRNLRFFTDWNNEDVLQIYLTALARVYDPHSDYLGRAQLEQFSIGMNLSLFGIGAELISEDGYCRIRRLLPGGPAIKSKLIKENDRIVAVAQSNQPPVDVVDMSLQQGRAAHSRPQGHRGAPDDYSRRRGCFHPHGGEPDPG